MGILLRLNKEQSKYDVNCFFKIMSHSYALMDSKIQQLGAGLSVL